jgi:hypothetical protein
MAIIVATGIASGSRFVQHEIDDPTAANVGLLLVAAMGENVGVFATRILERIRKNRHRVEVAGIVDRGRNADGGGGSPHGIEGDRAERIAEDVVSESELFPLLLVSRSTIPIRCFWASSFLALLRLAAKHHHFSPRGHLV